MRIVFTRNIKKPPSGSKVKKKSWPLLLNMMFLKSYVTAKGYDLPGNLPSPSQSLDDDDTSVVRETHREENAHEEEERTRRENEISEQTKPKGPPPKKNRKCQSITADDIVVDYIRSKTEASKDNPRKLLLMSLLPDVENMTTPQFKNF